MISSKTYYNVPFTEVNFGDKTVSLWALVLTAVLQSGLVSDHFFYKLIVNTGMETPSEVPYM